MTRSMVERETEAEKEAVKATRNMTTFLSRMNNVTFDLDNTDYRPIKNIGSGAYGVVCSAEHKVTGDKVNRGDLHFHRLIVFHGAAYAMFTYRLPWIRRRQVAIKKIPKIFEHLEIAKRTCREIRILRHFKHDNVIGIRRIFGDSEVKGQRQGDTVDDVYIVLDLMDYDLHKCIYSVEVSCEDVVSFQI